MMELNGAGNYQTQVLSNWSTLNYNEACEYERELSETIPCRVAHHFNNKEGRKRVSRYYMEVANPEWIGCTMDKVREMNDARNIKVHELKTMVVQGIKIR